MSQSQSHRPPLHFMNSPFGDTTFTKVFVGGLAWETHDESLLSHFARFGEILEAVVITDKNTGRSKGYGFVTFRDPLDAAKACADPNPVIDGRRANCNLASLGRPRPLPDFGHPRAGYPYFGSVQGLQGPYVGNHMYQQPVSYNNQQGFTFPPYGYTPYGSNYVYPQGIYNTYAGQQYLQMYGLPGAVGSAFYPYGHLRQPIPGNVTPSHQMVQFSGPGGSEVTAAPLPTIQTPYHTVVAATVPTQRHVAVTAHPHNHQSQGSGSDQASS